MVAIAVVSGCASVGDQGTRAGMRLPASLGLTSAPATPTSSIAWPRDEWWKQYDDAVLNDLIAQALAQNPTLKIAETRIRRAEGEAGVINAQSRVQINGAVDSTYERFSKNGLIPPPYAGSRDFVNDANINFGFNLDLFGRNRALLDAAIGQVAASHADEQAARVLLAANVARSYSNLARLTAQRGLASATLVLREQTRQLIAQRAQQGLDNNIDLQLAEQNLSATRVEIAQIDEQIATVRHQLSALIGAAPDSTATLQASMLKFKNASLPNTILAIPANLLGRRADIAAARARVESLMRNMDATKTGFYPNINLNAFVGLASLGLSRWIDSGSAQYGVGPAISIPIFSGGRLRSMLKADSAIVDAAIETYNQTLLDAVRDVADQISSAQSVRQQLVEQRAVLTAAQAQVSLAEERYQAGIINRLPLLAAENTALAQQKIAVDLQARQMDIDVNLNRALGGGYVQNQGQN